MKEHYTFGDNDRASARLGRLAEIYEPETRALLERSGARAIRLAVDLGCGPGWSTRLVRDVLAPARTVGLDASDRYVGEARRRHGPDVEFEVHDVTRAPFPIDAPDLLLCRFLLTHLRDPEAALATWAAVAAPGALLLLHETESLASPHPALRRYYELLSALQAHYGQALDVGAKLDACLARSGWRVAESRAVPCEKPAAAMAGLHLANVRTWRHDEHARAAFDPHEIDRLEGSLERIAAGEEDAGAVANVLRQVVAVRP
jgi:SAM-dependent methyltransferase